jgi:hypothetical protein
MSTTKIRKQVNDLLITDFEQYPVWEFALDEEGEEGQDEATVRPYSVKGALDPSEGMFVVRARFVLADGTQLQGYLTPPVQGDSSLGTLQPIIVTPQGQVCFWCGTIAPGPDTVTASYALLGKSSPSQVFPVRFETDVLLVGGPVRGEVPGFLVLEDLESTRARLVL